MSVQQRSTKCAILAASVCAVAGAMASQAMAVDSFKVSIGVRESGTASPIGGNGGATGSIEWVNLDGPTLVADGTWQHITFNFGADPVTYFAGTQPAGGANNQLDGVMGALEHLRIRNTSGVTSPIALFVDNIINTVGGVPTVVEDFESYAAVTTPTNGAPEVVFRDPRFSGSTNTFLTPTDTGNVTAESADQGANSYRLGWQFNSSTTSNWVRLTTNGTANRPNPAINFAPGSSLTFSLRAVVTPVVQGWNVDADGSWNVETNWAGSAASNIPNSTSAVARFGGAIAITAPRTVTIETAPTVSQVVFSSPISYTIAAVEGQGLILNAPAGFDTALTVEAGSHTFTAPIALSQARRLAIGVNNASSVLTIEKPFIAPIVVPPTVVQSDMVKSGPGMAAIHSMTFNAVSLTGGTVKLAAGTNTTSKVDSLSISGTVAVPTATLDITNNRLVVDWDTAATTPRPDALLSTRSKIIAGYAAGAWTGTGITSSTAAADARFAIGYGDANGLGITDFGGLTVDAQATLVRLTYKGDATLDGTVGFADLVPLAQNYDAAYDPTGPGGPKLWVQGDFNYDGKVDFADLVPLAQNYNLALSQDQIDVLGADFAADYALASSLVPEPTSLAAMAGAASMLLRRRRAR
jgi:hypothetical protein